MDLEKLEVVGAWNWEKAEVTDDVFLGDTLEKETSANGEESSVILFQKFSFSGPPGVLRDFGVDDGIN